MADEERRYCEAINLLVISNQACTWHKRPLGKGGAQLILSQARAHLWPFRPPTLRVVDAVMGASVASAEANKLQRQARRPLDKGELGILLSNRKAWESALEQGWQWCLVLEDDATWCPLPPDSPLCTRAPYRIRRATPVRGAPRRHASGRGRVTPDGVHAVGSQRSHSHPCRAPPVVALSTAASCSSSRSCR